MVLLCNFTPIITQSYLARFYFWILTSLQKNLLKISLIETEINKV